IRDFHVTGVQTCALPISFGVLLSAPAFALDEYPLWEAGLGVGALTLPDYRGSDERTNYVFPLPYFIYRGDFLRVDREGAQTLLRSEERRVGKEGRPRGLT